MDLEGIRAARMWREERPAGQPSCSTGLMRESTEHLQEGETGRAAAISLSLLMVRFLETPGPAGFSAPVPNGCAQ
jgi:hypothetical protein